MPESKRESKAPAKSGSKSGAGKSTAKSGSRTASKSTSRSSSSKASSSKTTKSTKPTKTTTAKTATSKEPADSKVKPIESSTVEKKTSKAHKDIIMKPPIIVKDLAGRMELKPYQLVHQLMEMNIFASLNQAIEEDVAKKVCETMGFNFALEKREKGGGQVHAPVKVVEPPKPEPVKESELQNRPPIITFMGHVDHGKTSLLDAIRQTRVTEGEAGGITQHVGAYQVERNGQKITFIDTPGHQAFTEMRSRGANLTDIVVLVVAADDGVMPTTIEAINHAKAAGVAIMVAVNKMDLPSANPNKVLGQLQEYELVAEDYGGDTICVQVSATKHTGIEKLLEMMLLQSEVLELKAKPSGPARGTVVESTTEVGRGATATVIVQSGTLRVGDAMLVGNYYGRVKALMDDLGKNVKAAGPSTPVKVVGLNGSPLPGEEFTIMRNDREAREISEQRRAEHRTDKLSPKPRVSLNDLREFLATRPGDGTVKKKIGIVLKADAQGSIEAIIGMINKIESDKIEPNFIHTGVGPITESDILLADTSEAIVIGFNTRTDGAAASAAKREGVEIRLYSIIYELVDQVKEAMAGMLDPELRESQLGTAVVKKIFKLNKFNVAGCNVETGRIVRGARARILRRDTPIYDGGFHTLKRFQDEVAEVRAGLECGVRLGDFDDYAENDVIECYQLEKVPQTL